jgi:hypothetical protein
VTASGAYALTYSYSGANLARTASVWTISGSAGGVIQWSSNAGAGAIADVPGATSTWVRRSATYAGTQQYIRPSDGRDLTAFGGIVAGARDSVIDFAQIEDTAFATEVVLGSGVRAAGYYSVDLASIVDASGRLAIEIDFRPRGAYADYTLPLELLYVDANNKIEMVTASSPFVAVTIAGTTFTSQLAAPWDARQRSKLTVIAGGGQRTEIYWGTRLDAGDATFAGSLPIETMIGYSDAAQSNFPTSGTGYALAKNDGSSPFAAWLYGVYGYRASWRKVTL